jgi:hypothetical protein
MTKIEKRSDGYWIIELPYDTPDCGPYLKDRGNDSDQCAREALRGIEDFFLYEYLPILTRKKVLAKVRKVT